MTATEWRYRAIDADGNAIGGEVRAETEGDAAERVRHLGYRPLALHSSRISVLKRDFHVEAFAPKAKPAELIGSIRQLAAMLGAGVPLMRALGVIVEQSGPALQGHWGEVRGDIECGDALSTSLERHPRVFDATLTSLVRAGEASGSLDQSLIHGATVLERRASLRRKVRSALAYPIAVLCLVTVVILAMSLFVVPVFRTVYDDLGGELPVPTQVVLAVSGFIGSNIILLVLAAFGVRFAFRRMKATPSGEMLVARLTLDLPLVGNLIRHTVLARAARSLAVLTAAGVPLMEALEIAGRVSGNAVVRDVFTSAGEAVRNGRPLSAGLAVSPMVPPLFSQMVAVGEESGDLSEMLGLVADIYESEVDAMAETFSAVIEPLLVAFLGIVVGGIVLSLYLPMFRLVDLVQ